VRSCALAAIASESRAATSARRARRAVQASGCVLARTRTSRPSGAPLHPSAATRRKWRRRRQSLPARRPCSWMGYCAANGVVLEKVSGESSGAGEHDDVYGSPPPCGASSSAPVQATSRSRVSFGISRDRRILVAAYQRSPGATVGPQRTSAHAAASGHLDGGAHDDRNENGSRGAHAVTARKSNAATTHEIALNGPTHASRGEARSLPFVALRRSTIHEVLTAARGQAVP